MSQTTGVKDPTTARSGDLTLTLSADGIAGVWGRCCWPLVVP